MTAKLMSAYELSGTWAMAVYTEWMGWWYSPTS